jgi:purine-binding chemotaxis protein CheW
MAMSDLKEDSQNLLIFHASGLKCAFPLDAVREIVPMAELASPPGLPSGLAGFLNLRGTAIPIVRFDRLFDLPEQSPGLHTPMIILRGVLAPIGVLVAAVHAIVAVPPPGLIELPGDRTFKGCATAVLEIAGETVHVLSAAELVGANEDRLLAGHGLMMQARLLHREEAT